MRRLIPQSDPPPKVKLVRGAVDDSEVLRARVEAAMSGMTLQNGPRAPRLRIFSNNGTRDDFATRFLTTKKNQESSLQEHLECLWPEGYCIAVNDISCWAPQLHDTVVARFIKHWIERFGENAGGIDVYAFVGRYQMTPFGVHKDDEDSYLFNLGPSEKTAYVWTREELVNSFGADALTTPVFQFESGIAKGNKYKLYPGDGLLVPRGIYHVLESPEYSVMMGIAPYLLSPEKIVAAAIKRHFGRDFNSLALDSYLDDRNRLIDISRLLASSIQEGLSDCLLAELLLLRSNSFIRGTPVIDESRFADSAAFRLDQLNQLQRLHIGDRLHIFVRGTEISFGSATLVEQLLDAMSKMEVFTIDSLHNQVGTVVSLQAVTSFTKTLYLCGGVREHEPD